MANAAPTLFKDAEASVQRLRQYLAGEESNVSSRSFVSWSHCLMGGWVLWCCRFYFHLVISQCALQPADVTS